MRPFAPHSWLVTAILAAGAGAAPPLVEAPDGSYPELDGVLAEGEWRGAAILESPQGRAFLKTSGRALCIALQMSSAYAGERIDLEIADADGLAWSWHSFHPAAFFPQGRISPVAPVLARRGTYSMRAGAALEPPYGCIFRARVFRKSREWSAEIALSREAVVAAEGKPVRFRLIVGPPESPGGTAKFASPEGKDAPLADWPLLQPRWGAEGGLFETQDEDVRRAFELDLFQEWLDQTLGKEPRKPVLGPALDGKKDNALIERVLTRLSECVEADAGDFFARCYRLLVLRRANRIEEANQCLRGIDAQFPHAGEFAPLLQERVALLSQESRFAEILDLRAPAALREAFAGIAALWEKEAAFRRADAEGVRGPLLEIVTTKGRIRLAPYLREAPDAAAALLALARGGSLDRLATASATGGLGVEFDLPEGAALPPCPEPRRLAWRGTLSFLVDPATRSTQPRLLLATGQAHLSRPALAAAGVVEGMDVLDSLEYEDRIVSAKVEEAR